MIMSHIIAIIIIIIIIINYNNNNNNNNKYKNSAVYVQHKQIVIISMKTYCKGRGRKKQPRSQGLFSSRPLELLGMRLKNKKQEEVIKYPHCFVPSLCLQLLHVACE